MHGIPSNETSSTSFLLEKKKMKISSDLFNKDDFFQKKLSIYYIASFSELFACYNFIRTWYQSWSTQGSIELLTFTQQERPYVSILSSFNWGEIW